MNPPTDTISAVYTSCMHLDARKSASRVQWSIVNPKYSDLRLACRIGDRGRVLLNIAITMTARSLLSLSLCVAAAAVDYDVIVYGATPAGVLAAIGAANETTRVLLVHYLGHIGGMSAGGLGKTDVGNQDVIAAGAAQFFNTYCYCAKPTGCAPGNATGYLCTLLTPKTAEDTFEYMVAQTQGAVTLMKSMTLQAVSKSGSTLSSVTFVPTSYAERHPELPVGLGAEPVDTRTIAGAQTITASMFIDGTYEGDLLAAAGVSYTVGREGQSQYNESYAGRLAAPNSLGGHQFTVPVNPYDAPGQLSPLISHGNPGVPGQADSRVQAYNFRLCLTKNATNQAPLTAPPGYNASYWDLLIRFIQAANKTSATDFFNIGDVGLGKTDFNNNGAISTDVIGWADAWPEGTPAQRADLWACHKNYTQGFIYTLATDPRVPQSIRTGMSAWGYCADEFTDNGNWPWQLYIREGRRMVSDFVFTQADREAEKVKPDCVGAYSYNIG